ncbi:hypothetical protein AAG570_003932 [Ranatra chinensis]|uniref:Uncharacterized protein n=1 Tax=Ranatra chinensis TaxID=642074 RepID=A0ABD0Y2C0_9HEMI
MPRVRPVTSCRSAVPQRPVFRSAKSSLLDGNPRQRVCQIGPGGRWKALERVALKIVSVFCEDSRDGESTRPGDVSGSLKRKSTDMKSFGIVFTTSLLVVQSELPYVPRSLIRDA